MSFQTYNLQILNGFPQICLHSLERSTYMGPRRSHPLPLHCRHRYRQPLQQRSSNHRLHGCHLDKFQTQQHRPSYYHLLLTQNHDRHDSTYTVHHLDCHRLLF